MKNVLLAFLLLVIEHGAFCQDTVRVVQDEVEIIPTKTIQSSTASGFLSYNSFTRLSATNNGVSAEGTINYLVEKAWNFSLNVSTPVTNETQQVKPLTLAGLSNNSSLSFGAQKIWWGNGFKYDHNLYQNAIKAIGKNPADFNYDDLTPEEQREFDRKAKIKWGTAFYIGAKAGLEQNSFEYVADLTTLASEEVSKTAFKATGTVGILNSWGIIALTFAHTNGYQADAPVRYYIPINNTGAQIAKDLSPGVPVRQNSEKLRFEYLSSGYAGSRLRINPNINVEFNQQLFSFELPVYFLTSDKDRTNFNGGIYAGYVSNEDFKFNTGKNNLGFGVFIGASFTSLFQ